VCALIETVLSCILSGLVLFAGANNRVPQTQMTSEQVQAIVQKYVNEWNTENPNYPMWIVLAGPGDPLNIPGATFPQNTAGMEQPINAHLIVLNKNMVAESILTTFAHEYGHAVYRRGHTHNFNDVDSEVAAIRSSLTILPKEDLEPLAYREAKAINEMAAKEPYKSAVQRLESDSLWRKYRPQPGE